MDSKKAVQATPKLSPLQLGQNTQLSTDSVENKQATQPTTSHQITPRVLASSSPIDYIDSDDSTVADSDCMIVAESPSKKPRPLAVPSCSSAARYTRKTRPSTSPDVTEKKRIKVEKDEKKRPTTRCFFCCSKKCHEDVYGAYCSKEARAYMKNRSATEEGLHDLFASYYTAAVKLDLHRSFKGTFQHAPGLKHIPSCMMNSSYLKCVNEFRTDHL